MPTEREREGHAAIERLRASVTDLLVAAAMAPEDEAAESGPGAGAPAMAGPTADEAGWTPRKVLGHVLWWHERYLKVLSAKVDGRPNPKLPGALDDINVAGVRAYGERSIDDLSEAIRAKEHALESLVAVLYDRPAAARSRLIIRTRDGATPVGLDGFVKRVTDHLHGHAADLRSGR